MATLTANKYALPSGVAGGGTQDMASGSWGEIAGVLTGPTDGTINSATSLRMQVGGVDGMRIDNSRNVLMGKTTTGANNEGAEWDEVNSRFFSTTDGNNQAFFGKATGGAYSGNVLQLQTTRTVTSGAFNFITCHANDGTDLRFNVQANGDATNSNNSYGAISDLKLKRDIKSAKSQLGDILALGKKVCNFKFISDVKANGKDAMTHLGWVAQDVQKISPGLVSVSPDMVDEEYEEDGETKTRQVPNGEETLSVKYSIANMKLFKAFCEYVEKTDTRLEKAGIS